MDSERLAMLTDRQIKALGARDYCRWLQCLDQVNGREIHAHQRFLEETPRSAYRDVFEKFEKAAQLPLTTTDSTAAGPLAVAQPLANVLLEYVRPSTIRGKLKNLRLVPLNVSVPAQTATGSYGWTGQNVPKIVTKAAFSTVTLPGAKAAGLVVVTDETMKFGVSTDIVLRSELEEGLRQFLDAQFVDPTVAEVANVSPGSVLNGAANSASSGATAANAVTDVKLLVSTFVAANPDITYATLLMSPSNAHALGIAANSQTLGWDGGSWFGVPVVTSNALTTNIAILDPSQVLYSSDDSLRITPSRQASVEMSDTPANPTLATTVLISLWQAGLVGLLVEYFGNWKRARTTACRYLTGANYA